MSVASASSPLDWNLILTAAEQRDRESLLPRLMLVTNPDCLAHPQKLLLRDEDLAKRIVTENVLRLEAACRVQRVRGLRGDWTYDKAMHAGAVGLLTAERRVLTALEQQEVVQVIIPSSHPAL